MDIPPDVRSGPSTIEHLFAKAGTLFLLPFHTGDRRGSYLDRVRDSRPNGASGAGLLETPADAIFFAAEVNEPGGRQEDDA